MGFGKDGKGQILRETVTITVGALAARGVVKHTGGVALDTTSFRILKSEYFIVTATPFQADLDQLIFGFANGALSTAQIAAAIEADGPDDRNDPDKEETMRAVWLLAHVLEGELAAPAGIPQPLNNGLPLIFKPRWTFTPTEGWDWIAYNPLDGAITTGAVFNIVATHFGVWVD